MKVIADFHNHSCLSPCASLDMSPSLLARQARARGLELVALTDHNSALNAPAWLECARREGLVPLFGLEATSIEEVHVLCLFGTVDEALGFGEYLRVRLLPLPYDRRRLGDQVVVDADEGVVDLPEIYFGAALTLGFDELCAVGRAWDALVIPAHIDRPMFGAISQLGFLPEGPYQAVELMRPADRSLAAGHTVTTGSDAHYPEHIGRRPFGIELPPGWKQADGLADMAILAAALRPELINLPGQP
ncbi:MAG: hypothetical protein A2087_09435 [Spirochaetes bacterium GWD1_61_31]|nr:MAG: hypothetical protein A2Y37_09510 [Spirochaetes bacterium GWB1_60_80]OHD41444.1 MAG: hypothetical protein A2Y35_05815 [Spirochaetes bacterium GWE1_60_18]OHD43689.1 MAG: hypothetical protein A2087_09435 [Spirochaetes bacterium GWD1_61_31]